MMSTGNLILVLVLGGVFLIVVIWALFFWQRYMKMYNSSSDDDDDGNLEAGNGDNHRRRHSRQRVSLIRTISCSNNQNDTRNYNTDIPLSNLRNGHDEGLNGEDSSNNLLPENTQISSLSNGPPSYHDLRGSFLNVNENEDPPSYNDVQLPSS